MSRYNYVVTAQKPTAVYHSLTGHFTGASDLNLILGKCTRIEIHLMTPQGLEPVYDIGVNGRIGTLRLFRPKGQKQDNLFVCTESFKFFVLAFDKKQKEVITVAKGDLKHKIGKPSDVGQLGAFDPSQKLIAMHMYESMIHVLPLDEKGNLLQETYDMRMDESQIIQMVFLHGFEKPTLCVLYQDTKEKRHLKTYTVNMAEKELNPGKWDVQTVETQSAFLIPIQEPFGGVLVIGEEVLAYYNGSKNFKAAKMKPARITAYGMVDKNRYLLSDLFGNLSMVVLKHDGKSIIGVHLDPLGTVSAPATISYLDNGFVYIGSTQGDSQLIKLNPAKNESGSHVEVLEEYSNIGPIVDFVVADLDRQGQSQLITCSGGYKDGSLRFIRNGIGINEEASIDLPGMKGLWSLKKSFKTEHHTFLVESFVTETRILAIQEEQLDEVSAPGLDDSIQTFFCGNLQNDTFVQVTKKECRMINCEDLSLIQSWKPPSGSNITVASANATQVLIALGKNLVLLQLEGKKLVEKVNLNLDKKDIACIDLTPLNEKKSLESNLAAIGMWDMSILLVQLPSLKILHREDIGGQIIPRSLKITQFQENPHLLCGLGDGQLLIYKLDIKNNALDNKKKIPVGTQPISLTTFQSKNVNHVFAACDRPTLIYPSSTGKLLYANINLKDVNYMAPFNAEVFPNSLAFASESALVIGQMDKVQKLHIRSIPLKQRPFRIAHQPSSDTLVVTTIEAINQEGEEKCYIKLFDAQSGEELTNFPLEPFEYGSATISLKFSDDGNDYYVVGTTYALPDEPEPTHGRLIVFRVEEKAPGKKLTLVTQQPTNGAVYSMASLKGKLVAGINSKVQLYSWKKVGSAKKLEPEASCQGNVIVLDLKTVGDFIVVADLMKSISVISYSPEAKTLEQYANDHESNWMTAIEALSDEVYVGAESSFNLFSVARNLKATTDEEKVRLDTVGGFHLGEMINKIRQGSLVMNMMEDSPDRVAPSHVFASANGYVGVLAPLSKEQFLLLSKVEEAMQVKVPTIGDLSHKEWRAMQRPPRQPEAKRNFIDGDLIELFLDLSPAKANEVAQAVGLPAAELYRKIEDLSRIH